MKKILMAALICGLAGAPLVADIIYPDGNKPTREPFVIKKLARGLTNLATGPFEIPKAAFDQGAEFGVLDFEQITLGFLVRGPYKALRRMNAGLLDLVTCNNESSPPKRMHLEPEFLNFFDVLPGYNNMFKWETIDTPAYRLDTQPDR